LKQSDSHSAGRGWDRPRRFRDLNLTDVQESQIAEICTEYRTRVQEARNKLRATVREKAIVAVIKGWEESPPVKGDTYRVADRSVVMLFTDGRG
jgi:hypothetical protein